MIYGDRLNTDDTVRARTCYPSTVSKEGTIWCILYACNLIFVYGIRVVFMLVVVLSFFPSR
jgi:hypothetical protein